MDVGLPQGRARLRDEGNTVAARSEAQLNCGPPPYTKRGSVGCRVSGKSEAREEEKDRDLGRRLTQMAKWAVATWLWGCG